MTTPTGSPLHQMAERTQTDYWNDSCSVEELTYAVERGAVGATSNPPIVLEVMQKEKSYWTDRVLALHAEHPTWTEEVLTWAIVEEMGVRAAKILEPVFEREGGKKGRLSIQINPTFYVDPQKMVEQAVRFAGLGPNIQVKLPTTRAGVEAIEEATVHGVNVNATVSFTVSQMIAVAEAVERGLKRREAAGHDTSSMTPVCTLMVGRLDDWMKVLVDRDALSVHPDAPNWAGVAAFKRAYQIYRERGYRTRPLAAAYRHRLHWTEFVGGDVVLTIPSAWQKRFNASGIDPVERMDVPVDPAIIRELEERIPDFRRAYEPDGLTPAEFDTYGATARTLRQFVKAYHDLVATISDIVLPNPDVKR